MLDDLDASYLSSSAQRFFFFAFSLHFFTLLFKDLQSTLRALLLVFLSFYNLVFLALPPHNSSDTVPLVLLAVRGAAASSIHPHA